MKNGKFLPHPALRSTKKYFFDCEFVVDIQFEEAASDKHGGCVTLIAKITYIWQFYFLLISSSISCAQNNLELSAKTRVELHHLKTGYQLKTESINEITVSMPINGERQIFEKYDTYLIRELISRDNADYYYNHYDSAIYQVSIYKTPNLFEPLAQFSTVAQFSFLWRAENQPFYVTVSNYNYRKGLDRVYSFFNIKTGKLLITGNDEEPLIILSSSDRVRNIIGYQSNNSIPHAGETWSANNILDKLHKESHEYDGILTLSSDDQNLQKFALFAPVFCLGDRQLFFEQNNKRLTVRKVYDHEITNLHVILKAVRPDGCSPSTYRFKYNKKTGRLESLSPQKFITALK